VATVSTPGLCSARPDLEHAPAADELAAAELVPVPGAAAELAVDELLVLELPHAAINTAARAAVRRAERRCARDDTAAQSTPGELPTAWPPPRRPFLGLRPRRPAPAPSLRLQG
jgi:hypothetical protein